MKCRVILMCLGLFIGVQAQAANPAPLFEGIRKSYFTADTHSSLAQRYFNQGMVLFYGFDYLEAIRSFEAALKLDKHCERCRFALALSLGSVGNAKVKGDEVQRAQRLLQQAKPKDDLTNALITALKLRYRHLNKQGKPEVHRRPSIELPTKNNIDFADAMFALTKKYRDNQTVLNLFAFSVINVNEWLFYDDLLNPRPYTVMMINALEKALKINPDNVGSIHYFIHGVEWSSTPERALPYANRLGKLAPLAEHLVHMPTHIYLRLGDYPKAVKENVDAVLAYRNYEKQCRAQGFEPVMNFLDQHNYNFLFAASLFAGNQKVALEAAAGVKKTMSKAWAKEMPMMQRFSVFSYWAYAHFGLWNKVKSTPKPIKSQAYAYAMWAYIQGLYAVNQNDFNKAMSYLKIFNKAARRNNQHTETKTMFSNNLQIARLVLKANIAAHKQQWEKAITYWHRALMKERAIEEPPMWYFPIAQGLGFTFLKANKPEQAIDTFTADLKKHPNNGWSLFGLAEGYKALGNNAQYQKTMATFKKAWGETAVRLPIAQGSDIF